MSKTQMHQALTISVGLAPSKSTTRLNPSSVQQFFRFDAVFGVEAVAARVRKLENVTSARVLYADHTGTGCLVVRTLKRI